MARGKVAKILGCALVLAVLCIPAVFVNTAIGYMPALFFIALLALCFAYVRLCARGLSSDAVTGADSCQRGGNIGVLVRVRNAFPLFVPRVDVSFRITDLFGAEALAQTSSIALQPRDSQDFEFDLGFAHLGEFQVGVRDLAVYDPTGLFRVTVPAQGDHAVLVTPRLRVLDDLALTDTSVRQVSDALKPSYSSGEDYSGVREYVPGDPMKLIHWKLSARTEDYFTKTFETHADPSLDVFVDFSAPAYDAETLMSLYDAAVELALSLEAHAYDNGMATRLVFLDADGEVDQFNLAHGADVRELMRRIPRIQVGRSEAFADMLVKRGTSIHAADNIAVCSACVDAALGNALALVRNTRRAAFAFSLIPSDADRQRRAEAHAALRPLADMGVVCSLVEADGGGVT